MSLFTQLFVGSVVISLTIVVEALFIGAAIGTLTRFGAWLTAPPHLRKTIFALIGVTLWLLAGLTIGVWIWAAAFISLDLFAELEPALYFSIVAFTTLGFGDITIEAPWRLLSGIAAANGLLLFGLSTAFLVEFLRRLREGQRQNNNQAPSDNDRQEQQ